MFQRRTLNVDPLQQTCHSVTQVDPNHHHRHWSTQVHYLQAQKR